MTSCEEIINIIDRTPSKEQDDRSAMTSKDASKSAQIIGLVSTMSKDKKHPEEMHQALSKQGLIFTGRVAA